MKLNELKQGMVCELRGGDNLIIVNDAVYVCVYQNIIQGTNSFYNDDLTSKDNKQYDIIKVFYGDKVVWERKESTFWLPEEWENYHFISHFGSIDKFNNSDTVDKRLFKVQLVFRTEEEAEKQLLKQQATIRVIKEIARLNEGWLPNWKDENEPKVYIVFDNGSLMFDTSPAYIYKTIDNNLYLKSEYLAKQLIETHEQDLKRMLEVE